MRIRVTDVACAALLHNAVEDHAADIIPGGSRPAALAVLARQFGERAVGLVAAVTNPPWEPGRDKQAQYREHVAESLSASPWTRVTKVSTTASQNVRGVLIHSTVLGTSPWLLN